MKWLIWILVVSAASTSANDLLEPDGFNENIYETVEALYQEGKCERLSSAGDNREIIALLFLDDVLSSLMGGNAVASYFLHDFEVYRLVRDVNPTLSILVDYARREDVREQIRRDVEAIGKVIVQSDIEEMSNMDMKILMCSLYKMVHNITFDLDYVMKRYLLDLNNKVRHKNTQLLRRSLEDLR